MRSHPVPLSLFLCAVVQLTRGQCQPTDTASFLFPPTTAAGFEAQPVFSNLSTPRGIAFDTHGTLLVIERNIGVTAFVSHNDSTCKGFVRSLVANNIALTHGIVLDDTELYVSSQLQVLLYQYNPTTLSVSGQPKVIVQGLPSDGGSCTDSLLIAN